ncbi:hypothetical protein HALLA_09995 [Halostagnicola larsenii XH-48]|uniref:Uncharacterized protein n=1 Tax=Halostagnicola larsenii XH-48 TaxID=797299 RepID=W0JQ71_9EURY|nr:hypothetical protein [Halostagnicola larsenii]AHG00866.1 hypothetical protein HALLA_09995 [Halostagnicola larsenii XH-48]
MGTERMSTRRTVLRIIGGSAAMALVAGCGDDETESEEGTGNGQDIEGDDGDEDDGDNGSGDENNSDDAESGGD